MESNICLPSTSFFLWEKNPGLILPYTLKRYNYIVLMPGGSCPVMRLRSANKYFWSTAKTTCWMRAHCIRIYYAYTLSASSYCNFSRAIWYWVPPGRGGSCPGRTGATNEFPGLGKHSKYRYEHSNVSMCASTWCTPYTTRIGFWAV